MQKRFILRLTEAPYQSSKIYEAIEFAQALAAFEQQVGLWFEGDGVKLLDRDLKPLTGFASIPKLLASLKTFDITDYYVNPTDLTAAGFTQTDLSLPAQVTDPATLQQWQIDAIIAF